MDLYGTPAMMWEVMELSVGMQGEVLQQAVQAHKRPAAAPPSGAHGPPDAKRQMTHHSGHAGQHEGGGMDAQAQYYQQQPQGYDYSHGYYGYGYQQG